MTEKPVPSLIEERKDDWFWYFKVWNIVELTLTIGGIISVVISGAMSPHQRGDHPHWAMFFSAASGACILAISKLSPDRHAGAYIGAWRILDYACDRYRYDPNFTDMDLAQAKANGEAVIAGGASVGAIKKTVKNPKSRKVVDADI